MNEPKALSVREAFAKAGHPVPEGAYIYFDHEEGIPDAWWYATAEAWCFFVSEGWGAVHGGIERDPIDLSNLPAADAYDALPECVRKVVER